MTEIRHPRKGAKAPARQKFIVGEQASKNIEQVLNEYQTNLLGLSENEALDRLVIEGENEVAHEKAPPAWKQLLTSFKNPFIFVLMILAIVSFFTDYVIPKRQGEETDLTGVIIIVTMVVLSGLLRFWQEYRTNKAAEALKSLVRTTATVFRRDNRTGRSTRKELPIKCLVPGDIVLLSAGDMVPADLKLVESRDLFISQAILTGESIPVEKYDTLANVSAKSLEPASPTENELLEISNICLMGTNVTSGTARGIVVATGSKTYLGSLAKSIVGTRAQTAFDRGVNSVSWLLIRFMLVMVPIVLLINGFTKGDWFEATLFSLAVAVGLTPEMLPMIVSSNLAKGAIAMSKHKVIVKRLNAIQNFGAMDVLCTDKTGTLTQDRIILEHYLDSNGQKDSRILQLAWLNSFHQSGAKNMMDQAIIRRGRGNDKVEQLKAYQKIDELPFDFIRRKLSVTVKTPEGEALLICKGAAEEMLAVCQSYQQDGHSVLLDDHAKARIAELVSDYNKQGFRVLLLATRSLNDAEASLPLSAQAEQQLELRGILTFLDPAKESAISAIAALRENGVMVKVLTGDNAVITEKICHDVGLNIDEIMTGLEVEAMNDDDLKVKVEQVSVFCKLTPLQKSRILKLLQANGHTVGFLGDGINDAPALRDADVGISVDTGTDIAKESADIILLEKDLMVLEQGVIKGRETFGNIIKYLNMTASSNFGNVFSVLIASAFIPFLPMLAIHLLVQNLLYDMSQLALPWDKMDKEFLKRPRKWDAKNIGRFMIWIGPTSSIFDITTFALMWYVFQANSVAHEALFQSGWFVEGLLSQTLVVHMLRTQKIPFIQSTAALPVLLTTGIIMALGLYIPFSSFGTMIGLQPLPMEYFPWLVLTLVSYCFVAQGMKHIYIKRFGTWL
ncbi:magnesium-translocating P-type ATPase [Providencia alcalifaciens]|uniref:magnesium-translocating P-type ATPase n=1 Tax=Providencia alcalifaciens TaxID=126385 RepID=UPI001CC47213|nr:magnesium-translocating P-type ATPase [Providencia alcalifaciens]CAG9413030.1 Magnesium-transporting ATPase, P-type 1 [Providencia alcalifaciens]CAG9417070.1 Magnesium-transporting ATPase, P-type 1 [Providencia alcalifaciens]CAG9418066.1 Magnesium-transporting ATPase, P-type 1 [Providencia alcalifaciens]CAG9418230.1 Magnesium-transporting ATPase, P-type 1 [Providencia alcalifaciens]CAG9423933.1 Magnesium-transporting ATPase, P-type 1 [Providencia alcalifaciens]